MLPRVQNIKGTSNWLSVIIDLMMLGLTIFDLSWLMFDALYTTHTAKSIIDPILPFYQSIHQDFYFYDGIIVSIFIAEFTSRWAYAIYHKIYDKWFFYPFVHWYDVLGCFPTSSFRILRLFRIIGLTYRLHKWKVIDLNNYALFSTLKHYYDIAIEEISDRVVLKVLDEAKTEIQRGQPLTEVIKEQVILPKKEALSKMVSLVIQQGIQKQYPQYRKLLQKQVEGTVYEQVKNNEEAKQLQKIPLIGNQIQETLNKATSQIFFGVVDQLIQDASSEGSQEMIALIVDSLIDVLLESPSLENSELSHKIIIESIDIIMERVKVQQWKLKD